ncbi:hypothetical protein KUTeg_002812 [Tegillarca granosa]|uniref:Uncharacterized protein n=1 Tax=Tegillarca granosa TaxID=220873 RepID=A0ABQ9FUG8_TEGGR|nr:hypothetical protein KUTeg_002812 [Tegillarca granosa]
MSTNNCSSPKHTSPSLTESKTTRNVSAIENIQPPSEDSMLQWSLEDEWIKIAAQEDVTMDFEMGDENHPIEIDDTIEEVEDTPNSKQMWKAEETHKKTHEEVASISKRPFPEQMNWFEEKRRYNMLHLDDDECKLMRERKPKNNR